MRETLFTGFFVAHWFLVTAFNHWYNITQLQIQYRLMSRVINWNRCKVHLSKLDFLTIKIYIICDSITWNEVHQGSKEIQMNGYKGSQISGRTHNLEGSQQNEYKIDPLGVLEYLYNIIKQFLWCIWRRQGISG